MYALSVVRLSGALAMIASLVLLPACTPSSSALNSVASVEEAFLTSDIVPIKPYTRSIINSTNF